MAPVDATIVAMLSCAKDDKNNASLKKVCDAKIPITLMSDILFRDALKECLEIDEDCVMNATSALLNHHSMSSTFEFPPPKGINVNMMPVDLSKLRNFYSVYRDGTPPEEISQKLGLPQELHDYVPLIFRCIVTYYPTVKRKHQEILYLTVHESDMVEAGRTQRRPGIHIEAPYGDHRKAGMAGNGRVVRRDRREDDLEYRGIAWGRGNFRDNYPIDGIMMASNVSESCEIWPVKINSPERVCSHKGGFTPSRSKILKKVLEDMSVKPHRPKANEIYWMTDRTIHEALPMKETGPRQFFRLVLGQISHWHSRHNTPNPCGVVPPP